MTIADNSRLDPIRAVEEILPDGTTFTFDYTVAGNTVTETRVTDPNGNTTTYRFNGQGYEARRIDPLGRLFKREIDYATNQLLSETDPLGRVTRYTYDANGNRTGIVDPAGNTTLIEYDPTWNTPTKVINALGHVTTMGYDDRGNLVSVTNPEGEATTFTYTPQGRIASIADPLDHIARFAYDGEGNLIQTTDPLGRVAQRRYDAANRLIEAIDRLRGALIVTAEQAVRPSTHAGAPPATVTTILIASAIASTPWATTRCSLTMPATIFLPSPIPGAW